MSSTYKSKNGSTLSKNMRSLGVENSRTLKNLDRELSRLDTEKKNKMRELDQASKHFLDLQRRASSARSRETSPDRHSPGSSPRYSGQGSNPVRPSFLRSPSPKPRSPLDDLSSMSECLSPRTQKIVYRKSLSTDEGGSPKQLSPTSSPESSPRWLLPRRSEENSTLLEPHSHNLTETSITNFVCLFTSGACKRTLTKSTEMYDRPFVLKRSSSPRARQADIPQIIVSDTTPKLPDINSTAGVMVTKQIKPKDSSKDSHTKKLAEKNNFDISLNIPTRCCRSNSVPALGVKADPFLTLARKESVLSPNEDYEALTEGPASLRPRSNSVCVPYYEHLKNAPRRDSLLRKYIARPKIYHRTARTIDQLICDIAKGICSEDFDVLNSRYKPISPEEWERLKQCRYLRMPSKNEDVKGNTLEMEEIFSHSSPKA